MDNDDKLVSLIQVNNEVEASVIVATLKEHGIPATATGGFTAGFRAEAPGYVDVMVNQQNLPEARRILETEVQEDRQIDWSEVDVGPREDIPDPPTRDGDA